MSQCLLEDIAKTPRWSRIVEISTRLEALPEVEAAWIGGSLANGTEDEYSDIDLRIAVTSKARRHWANPNFDSLFGAKEAAAVIVLQFGPARLFHLLLKDGEIYDVQVFSSADVLPPEKTLLLFCKEEHWHARLSGAKPQTPVLLPDADPETVRTLLCGFWINTHKHRKVLGRGLPLLCETGLQGERVSIFRLFHLLATGKDGGREGTIHSLTAQVRAVQLWGGEKAMELLGLPLRTEAEIRECIRRHRAEVALRGRELAQRLEFEYPEAAETTAAAFEI